jgi:DNA-binding ferritin-like protein (Dps family)
MTPEEAATKPSKHGGNQRKDSIFSEETMNRASALGIKYHTLYNRIKVYKWDLERALTEPIGRKAK